LLQVYNSKYLAQSSPPPLTTTTIIIIIIKVKGKVHPRTSKGHPEGEYRYSSPLPFTVVQDEGGWSKTPRSGLDGKSHPLWDLIPGLSGP